MGSSFGKDICKGFKFGGGGGLLQTLLMGVIGAIAWHIGVDIYCRLTRRKAVEHEPWERSADQRS